MQHRPLQALSTTLLSTGAPASRKNSVSPFQCRSRYLIALPSPEFGSVLRSANCASSHRAAAPSPGRCAADETATAAPASWLVPAPPHRSHTLGPASPARNGIRSGKFCATSTNCRLPWARQLSQQNLHSARQLRHIPRQRITHLNRARKSLAHVLQHVGDVLARMLASGEVQRDPPALSPVETMPLVNTPVRSSPVSALQFQYPHAGVVVVQHLALRRLPDQLIPRRLDQLRGLLDNLPLRRRRQRDPQLAFQLFQPVETEFRCRT